MDDVAHHHRHDIVAIGGSSGSINALKILFAALPADFDAAVFVVVHIGSEGRDLLAGIFDNCGPLPVQTAEDGQPIARGRVYVAPGDHHLLVIDDVIRLGRGPRENMTRPAIDPLFRSVAVSYGPRVIAVVLSGHLNDGAAGLADVARCGGVTVVQNPADAPVPDMPLGALASTDVAYRTSVSDLGALLTTLVRQPAGPAPAAPPSIELEVDIALGRPCLTSTLTQIADPVALTCPGCGGVLSQVRESPPLRFRCQVGHGYTAEALRAEKEGAIDEALRVALRIVEERATLADKMSREAHAAGRSTSSAFLSERAQELRGYAEVLRRGTLEALDPPNPAPDAAENTD